jgi:hypothetical protein
MGSADMDGIACLRKFDLGLWLIVEVGDVLASGVDIDPCGGVGTFGRSKLSGSRCWLGATEIHSCDILELHPIINATWKNYQT